MSVKSIQAIMTGLVVIAAVVAGAVLIAGGHDHVVGIGLLIIVAGYLGIDLTPWIPLGKNQRKKGGS